MHSVPPPYSDPPPRRAHTGRHLLATFDDCAGLALVLAGDFDHAHVAALTATDGRVLDGVVLTDPDHTIDHCVGYALALLTAAPHTAALTFITVVDTGDPPGEDHVVSWRRTWAVLAGAARCRDWMITDGQVVRSMAVSTGDGSGWARRGNGA